MNVYIPFIEMVCIWVGASTIISILRGKQKNKLLQEGKYTNESYSEARKKMQELTTKASNQLFNRAYNIIIVWYFFIVVFSLGAITANFSIAPVIYLIDAIFFFAFAVINLGASYYTQKVRRKINTELPEIKCAVKILVFIFRDFGTALVFLVSYLQA